MVRHLKKGHQKVKMTKNNNPYLHKKKDGKSGKAGGHKTTVWADDFDQKSKQYDREASKKEDATKSKLPPKKKEETGGEKKTEAEAAKKEQEESEEKDKKETKKTEAEER